MANSNLPFGARPVMMGSGGGNFRFGQPYTIASGYTSTIKKGDFVITTGTGRNIALAGTTVPLRGVFSGVKYIDALGMPQWSNMWLANTVATEVEAYVFDDRLMQFEIQADEDVVEGDIGQMADHVYGAGSTLTHLSGSGLDSSLIGSTGQLAIEELAPGWVYGNYAVVRVRIAEHERDATNPT